MSFLKSAGWSSSSRKKDRYAKTEYMVMSLRLRAALTL